MGCLAKQELYLSSFKFDLKDVASDASFSPLNLIFYFFFCNVFNYFTKILLILVKKY